MYFLGTINHSEFSNRPEPIHLEEEFNTLNLKSLWSYDIYIAQEPVCNKNEKSLLVFYISGEGAG